MIRTLTPDCRKYIISRYNENYEICAPVAVKCGKIGARHQYFIHMHVKVVRRSLNIFTS